MTHILPALMQTSETTTPNEDAAPLDAVGDVAQSTGEAAASLLDWFTSGDDQALIAVLAIVISLVIFISARQGLIGLLSSADARDTFSIGAIARRLLKRTRTLFLLIAAIYLTDQTLGLPEAAGTGITVLFVLAAVIQGAEIIQEITVSLIKRSVARKSGDRAALASAVNILKWLASVLIWSVALLLILDNLGANVTSLLAGLGIGGIAIGLAAQGIFQDLFSALSIIFDRPFQRGDTVSYGDTWGEIEDIGLKSTRIRSVTGEQIVISNTNLLDLEIRNLARMPKRRVDTGFGIVYDTDPDLAESVIGLVASIIAETEGVELERCNFIGFGASSLDYELVFFSLNPDFKRTKAATSKLLLKLFRRFHEEGIEFAFPTQTLHVASMPDAVVPNPYLDSAAQRFDRNIPSHGV